MGGHRRLAGRSREPTCRLRTTSRCYALVAFAESRQSGDRACLCDRDRNSFCSPWPAVRANGSRLMPRPVYIICHQTGMEDRESGLISLFFVIEKLHVTPFTLPQGVHVPMMIIPQQPFRVVATWMRNPDDAL